MPRETSQRLQSSLLPFLLFIFSFIIRLAFISKGPYHVDSLDLALHAQETFETHRLTYALGFGYPVVVALGALFIGAFRLIGITDPVLAFNSLSVVLSSMSVMMFYFLIRRLLDQPTAFVGAFLFSLSPIFLTTSVYGMNHVPAVCFLLTALYFLFGYLKDRRFSDFLWAGIFLGCMGASRLQDMILILPAVAVAFCLKENGSLIRKVSRCLAFFIFVAAVIFIFHLPYLLGGGQSAYTNQLNNYWFLGLVKNFQGIFSPHLKFAFEYLRSNCSWIGLVIAVLGFVWLGLKARSTAIFLAVWFLVPFLFLGNLVMLVPRFFIVLIPAVIIAQACALVYCFRRGWWGRWCVALLIVFLAIVPNLPVWPGLVYRHKHSAIAEYGRWFGVHTPSNAVIISADDNLFIKYYGGRSVSWRPVCSQGCQEDALKEFELRLDNLLSQKVPVYLTDIALLADNPGGEFNRFMSQRYQLHDVGRIFMEDWHHDSLELRVGWVKIYRVSSKF